MLYKKKISARVEENKIRKICSSSDLAHFQTATLEQLAKFSPEGQATL